MRGVLVTDMLTVDMLFSIGVLYVHIEVNALGVITISRGCFERCGSNKKTPP